MRRFWHLFSKRVREPRFKYIGSIEQIIHEQKLKGQHATLYQIRTNEGIMRTALWGRHDSPIIGDVIIFDRHLECLISIKEEDELGEIVKEGIPLGYFRMTYRIINNQHIY